MAGAVRTRGRRAGRARPGAVLAAATTALAVAGCGGAVPGTGARPDVAGPQLGVLVTGSPSPATSATGNAAECTSSLRPGGGDASSGAVERIRQRGRLIVGVAQDEFLTGYLDASGAETGFDIDIAKQVEQAIFGNQDAKHIQFKAVTNAQRITTLTSTDPASAVDMVVDTFTITCARAKQVLFSTVYYNAHQRLLVLTGSGYKSLDDLGGRRVCAQAGSTSIPLIQAYKSHPIAYSVTNLTDCLVALQQGQADAISTDDTILAGLARQDPNTAVVGPQLEPEPYGVAVSLRDPDLIRLVNGVLERMRGDGTWQRIYGQWLQPVLGPQQPPAAQYAD